MISFHCMIVKLNREAFNQIDSLLVPERKLEKYSDFRNVDKS